MIKLILADDHTLVRNAIAQALQADERLSVIKQCTDGNDLYEAILSETADVVLMDISMPGMNGLVALDKILQQRPDTKIIALSMHNEQEYIDAMQRGGAKGYVFKDATSETLVASIMRVHSGATCFPERLFKQGETVSSVKQTPIERLTRREREVFFLVVAGRSTREIADSLAMSVKTAENHRGKVLRKLEVRNTVELVHFAAKNGLLEA